MSNNISNPYEIALIGYTQAGKTTLAVGLYATSTEEFTVTGKGEETECYLRERKAALEAGQWLDPTNEQQMPDIRLALNRLGRPPVEIDFKEYMGERACNSDSYKRDVIGNPRAAMILLNPSMQILRDASKRNEMIGQIKDVVAYLSEPDKRCDNIAFVITASDLLSTTLADYKDEFDGYKEEITNCLNTNPKFQKAWKEFDVTVTGQLEDQARPRIARKGGNTSREPFEWLIERIEAADKLRSAKKIGGRIFSIATLLLVIAGSLFAGWYLWFDRESERNIDKIIKAHGAPLDKAIKDCKPTEINKICGSVTKALSDLPHTAIFFEANRKRYMSALTSLERRIEDAKLVWYPLEMRRFGSEMMNVDPDTGLTIDTFNDRKEQLVDFGKKVKSFGVKTKEHETRLRVVHDEWNKVSSGIIDAIESGCCTGCKVRIHAEREEVEKMLLVRDKVIEGEPRVRIWKAISDDYRGIKLTTQAKDALDAILAEAVGMKSNLFVRIDQHNAVVLEKLFACHNRDAAEKATEQACAEWRHDFESWIPFSKEGRDLQKKLLGEFDQTKKSWRVAFESKCFADESGALLSKLEKSCQNIDDGDQLNTALVECKKYEKYAADENLLPLVDAKTKNDTWGRIKKARGNVLEVLKNSRFARINPKGARPPELTDDDVKFLEAALKSGDALEATEYSAWMDGLNVKIAEVRKNWEAWQNRECEAFITSIEGAKDACGMLKKYENFRTSFPNAPHLTNVVVKINAIVVEALLGVIKETAEYRDTPYDSLNDDQAISLRRKRMNKTLNNLREICAAVVKAGRNSAFLKTLESYRFADACLSKGNINAGLGGAFNQKYHISRIDVRLDYAPQPQAWTREDGFPVNFKCVAFEVSLLGFDDGKIQKNYASIGACETLSDGDNRNWRTIWNGNATLEGSPWRDAVLSVNLTERNKVTEDISRGWWLSFRGGESLRFENSAPYWELDYELNFQRNTGDPNPKVHFRVYVTGEGYDFFDIVKNH